MFTHGLIGADHAGGSSDWDLPAQRNPLGYLLAPPILVLCILNGLNVIAATISQALAGVIFPPGVYIGMVGSWVVMGAFAVWLLAAFFRNLTEAISQQPEFRTAVNSSVVG
jgi:hypothetical protein